MLEVNGGNSEASDGVFCYFDLAVLVVPINPFPSVTYFFLGYAIDADELTVPVNEWRLLSA